MSSLPEDLTELDRLKAVEADLRAQVADAARERVEWEERCFERLVDEGYEPGDSHAKVKGKTYEPYITEYATIQDLDEFTEWAKENDLSFIQPKVQEGLLNQLVRTRIHNGEELPPGIGYSVTQKISIRGGTATRKRRRAPEADNE